MATTEQVQQMLDIINAQMSRMAEMSRENNELRNDAAPHNGAKTKRPARPIIEANLNDREWALWEDTWKRYKQITKLTIDAEICMELRFACSPDVNALLFEYIGPETLDGATEAYYCNTSNLFPLKERM